MDLKSVAVAGLIASHRSATTPEFPMTKILGSLLYPFSDTYGRTVVELLSSWHPLIASEQLTPRRLSEALDYWNVLLPLSQRMKELEAAIQMEEKTLTISDLIRLKFLSDKVFNEEIKRLHDELTEATKGGPVDYWKFVTQETYEETVMRAYALSFLISNGLANLIINPVEETTFVEALPGPGLKRGGKSVPISIWYQKWKELRGVTSE